MKKKPKKKRIPVYWCTDLMYKLSYRRDDLLDDVLNGINNQSSFRGDCPPWKRQNDIKSNYHVSRQM
jgi:hypothetical protein